MYTRCSLLSTLQNIELYDGGIHMVANMEVGDFRKLHNLFHAPENRCATLIRFQACCYSSVERSDSVLFTLQAICIFLSEVVTVPFTHQRVRNTFLSLDAQKAIDGITGYQAELYPESLDDGRNIVISSFSENMSLTP